MDNFTGLKTKSFKRDKIAPSQLKDSETIQSHMSTKLMKEKDLKTLSFVMNIDYSKPIKIDKLKDSEKSKNLTDHIYGSYISEVQKMVDVTK